MGPASFASLRRTSFSRAVSSPKSTTAPDGLQSDASFFRNASAGAAGPGTADDAAGALAEGCATGADDPVVVSDVFGSSQATPSVTKQRMSRFAGFIACGVSHASLDALAPMSR